MGTLRGFSYVVVRIACHQCGRRGSYRLVNLAVRFGATATLDEVLRELTRCRWPLPPPGKRGRRKYVPYCGAFYYDLEAGTPPDDPAASFAGPPLGLRVVGGREG